MLNIRKFWNIYSRNSFRREPTSDMNEKTAAVTTPSPKRLHRLHVLKPPIASYCPKLLHRLHVLKPPIKVRWHFEIFVSKIIFMGDMQTWDHLDAKFMLSAPPPCPCCFLWQFHVFRIWNSTHLHKISCQTQSFKHFVMTLTAFWPQEKPLSCDDFQFCVEHHGTEPWLHIY